MMKRIGWILVCGGAVIGLAAAYLTIHLGWCTWYAGWDDGLGADIRHGNGPGASLGSLHHFVADTELDPAPVSGRQEELENLVNRYIERTR